LAWAAGGSAPFTSSLRLATRGLHAQLEVAQIAWQRIDMRHGGGEEPPPRLRHRTFPLGQHPVLHGPLRGGPITRLPEIAEWDRYRQRAGGPVAVVGGDGDAERGGNEHAGDDPGPPGDLRHERRP